MYADMADLMEAIDVTMKESAECQEGLTLRKEASRKIINGSAEEKTKVLKSVLKWITNVRGIL